MTASMESPDRNLTITATDFEGSPFFNYLCSLSPIKPVKSAHVVQTFSELSFPPPPAVFVSPRVDAQNFLKRAHLRGRGEAAQATTENGQGNFWVDKEKSFLLRLSETEKSWKQVSNQNHGFGSINTGKSAEGEQSDVGNPCGSLSKHGNKYIEHYLDDPAEREPYSVGSSHQCTESSNLELLQFPVYVGIPNPHNIGECKETIGKQLATSALVPFNSRNSEMTSRGAVKCQISQSSDCQDLSAVIPGGTLNLMRQKNMGTVVMSTDKDNESTNSFRESSVKHLDLQKCGNDERSSELDQATSGFTFLLSEGVEKLPLNFCRDDWQNSSALTSSEFPMQHMSGFLATMREIVQEDAQAVGMDAGSSQVTSNSSVDSKSEVVLDPEGKAEQETENGQQSCRASIPTQRGVRRRCLDFEATEARRRNMNNLPMLKSLGLSSNNSLQGSSSFGSDASGTSSLLSERAAVTSDATNSKSPQVLDTGAHAPSKVEMVACRKAVTPQSAMSQLSHCSSQNNAECISDQCETQFTSLTRNSGIPPVSVGVPSGIGLHLNSLAGSMSLSHTRGDSGGVGNSLQASSKSMNSLSRMAPLAGLKEISSESYGNCLLAVNSGGNIQVGSTASFGPGLVVSLVERTRMDQHEVQSAGSAQVGVTKSTTCIRSVTLGIKPLEGNLPFSEVENKVSSLGGKRVLLQEIPHQSDLDQLEDSSQSPRSPKKKRKSIPAGEKLGEGCKRCNCKKSKCLKLYCECFAAGVYCVDSCSCHDCFNKPEFEDTVLGTRQQIESRNPLAFAPKIIRASDSSPIDGEECGDTPASARHKRGCNCKKSQCLKKYCECYQAGVGCADGCRCEGCKNIYGRKEGTEDFEDKERQVALSDKDLADEQASALELGNEFEHSDQQQNMDLSPTTPSFQHIGQCRSTLKLRSSSGERHFPSEEFHSPMFSISEPKPLKSPSRLLRSLKGAENTITVDPAGMHFSKAGSSPTYTPKVTRIGQFSPRWDGLGDICTLTPLLQAPLRPNPTSASFLDGAESSPSFNGQGNEHSSSCNSSILAGSMFRGGSPPPNFQHSVTHSPLCTSSSHHFQTPLNAQTTPMTPMMSSSFHISGARSEFGEAPDIYSHQFVGSTEEGDTPDFLKDSNAACSPVCILKTRSPKQKRVSPPHRQYTRDTNYRGITSPGLKSGRKFILQAMPSFPPSTPSFPSFMQDSSAAM